MRFGILKKVLIIFSVLSLVPVLALITYTLVKMNSAGDILIKNNRKVIVTNSLPLLEVRVKKVAESIEELLERCVEDINFLSGLPQTLSVHRNFYNNSKGRIWFREGTIGDFAEISKKIKLYSDVTFVNEKGILILQNGRFTRRKTDLSKVYKGPFGYEDYFQKAVKLKGKLYIGKVSGFHVNKNEQLKGTEDVEKAVGGGEYKGIIRFARAVYRKGELKGVVSIALDHRHLMEKTQHIVPLSEKEVVFPRYNSGNFAFSIDRDGWVITHPRLWYIRGADKESGRLFRPTSGNFNSEKLDKGIIPLNVVNIHTDYSKIASKALAGKTGIEDFNNKGVHKILAYAPIRLNHGEYRSDNCFGAVIFEMTTDIFNKALNEIEKDHDNIRIEMMRAFFIFTGILVVLLIVISYLYVSNIKRILFRLTAKINDFIAGDFTPNLDLGTRDEFELLGENLNRMGVKLKEDEKLHGLSLKKVENNALEVKKREKKLNKHIRMLQEIYSHADIFNSFSYYKTDYLYEKIVKICVDLIGFERAELYIADGEDNTELKFVKAYSPGNVENQINFNNILPKDSIQYSVFTCATEIIARDIKSSKFDEKMLINSRRERSYSFAALPLFCLGKCVGVLAADHITAKRLISREKESLIKIFAKEASHALDQALKLEEYFKNTYHFESMGILAESAAENIRVPLKELTILMNDIFERSQRPELLEIALEKIESMAEQVNGLSAISRRKDNPPCEVEIEKVLLKVFEKVVEEESHETEIDFKKTSEEFKIIAFPEILVNEMAETVKDAIRRSQNGKLSLKVECTAKDSEELKVKLTEKNLMIEGAHFRHRPFLADKNSSFEKINDDVQVGSILFSFAMIK